jgi:hypothetical protein
MNGIGRGVGWLGSRVGSMMQAAPRTAAAGIAGGATMLGTAETQQPEPREPGNIVDLRTRRQRSRDELSSAEARVTELTGNQTLIERAAAGNASIDDVKSIQRMLGRLNLYQGSDDGVWGGRTRQAAERYLQRIRTDLLSANERIPGLRETDTRLQGELNSAVLDWRRQRIMGNVSGLERFIQQNPLLIGAIGGPVSAGLWRWLAVRAGNATRAETIGNANRLLDPIRTGSADDAARAAALNRFYRGGGARNDPFPLNRDAPLGFSAAENQASASSLYPPGRMFQSRDVFRMGGFGVVAGLGEERIAAAQRSLDEARRIARDDPSETNIQNERAAEQQLSLITAGARIAQGALATYPITPASARLRYRNTAADTHIAEQEAARLNQLLGPRTQEREMQRRVELERQSAQQRLQDQQRLQEQERQAAQRRLEQEQRERQRLEEQHRLQEAQRQAEEQRRRLQEQQEFGYRRRNPNPEDPRGHWVAPRAPGTQPEIGERWVSEAGNNIRTWDGRRWVDERGMPASPPPSQPSRRWRRVSFLEPSDRNVG